MCTYHGWTFSPDGKLVGVPGFKEIYFGELDYSKWGLVEVAQLDTYKGLIFATFDAKAPSLLDYLGSQRYELDLSADRREGGAEVLGGVHRWVMKSNWKFSTDNFGGDDGHHIVTHGSVRPVVVDGRRWFNAYGAQTGANSRVNLGGGWITDVDASGKPVNEMGYVLGKYEQEHRKELQERLKDNPMLRSMSGTFVGSIFPNLSFSSLRFNVRIWHPKAPDKTEVWHYCVIDKAAAPEVKKMMRIHLTESFGPSGNLEQDDMNNWQNATFTSKGVVAQRQPMTILAGLGHDKETPVTGTKLRAIYVRWAEMMNAASWDDVSLGAKR
jgi:phenylpropionate dioxygenase-like ring-hydroxylating dioxygenase large terminal subunit